MSVIILEGKTKHSGITNIELTININRVFIDVPLRIVMYIPNKFYKVAESFWRVLTYDIN